MKLKVTNTKDFAITRGGQTFPPRATKVVDATKYSYQQIKACEYLKIETEFAQHQVAQQPQNAQEAPEQSTAPETALAEETTQKQPQEASEEVFEGDEEGDEDYENEDDGENDDPEDDDRIGSDGYPPKDDKDEYENNCPYCDNYGGEDKTKNGLTTHVRMAHPEKYEEYKKRR